jgi:hypothetical protein
VRIVLDLPEDLANYVAVQAAEMGVTAECFVVGILGSDAARQQVSSWDPTDGIQAMSLASRVRELRIQSDALSSKVQAWKMERSAFEAEVGSLFA